MMPPSETIMPTLRSNYVALAKRWVQLKQVGK